MSEAGYHHTWQVSWEKLQADTRALVRRIAPHGPFCGLVAVVRGGLVPAGLVAREMGLRRVEALCIASYDGKKQGECRVDEAFAGRIGDGGKGWLVMDDLADTGGTARRVRELLPRAYFAALYAKPAGKALLDAYVAEVSQDTWVCFPWDAPPLVLSEADEL